ncbi:MAG: hypothetical protein WDM89_06020 [Rhizomicrobium sp.]
MQDEAEGRVWIVNLDELKNAPDTAAWYIEKILAPIGLDMPAPVSRRIDESKEKKSIFDAAVEFRGANDYRGLSADIGNTGRYVSRGRSARLRSFAPHTVQRREQAVLPEKIALSKEPIETGAGLSDNPRPTWIAGVAQG